MIALILACCLTAPAEVTIDSNTVTLGAIVGFPSGDARAALSMGAAPQPGLGRRFLKQELIGRINNARLPIDDLQLPESVLVKRKAQGLDPAMVLRLVRDAYARQFPDADITLNSFDTPDVSLATGPLEMTAAFPAQADLSGPVFIALDIRGPGYSRKIFVKTSADVRRPQPTLKAAVGANTEVHIQDLEWKVTLVRGHGEQIQATDDLDGLLAKRDLPAGEVLTKDLLYAPLMVHKGESVTVKATNGGVTIAATMRARASARLGDTISVEHLSGTGFTSARVIGPRLLEATQGGK